MSDRKNCTLSERERFLVACVDKHRERIFEAVSYIGDHPETGFREWNTSHYLEEQFQALGYVLTLAGDIPGFYTDLDTGKPGPKVLVMGELDALHCEGHPKAVNGVAHACGHNAQCAGLLGLAAALKEPGAMDGLSGSIRLMAVPAEELVEVAYRKSLREQGTIRFLGGKAEFLRRGYMRDVDMAVLIHTRNLGPHIDFFARGGSNGFVSKEITYLGCAAHAGSSPELGINALYAAALGLQAINSLRETFREDQRIRVHGVITECGTAANVIPERAKLEMQVRGAAPEIIRRVSGQVDRALTGAAVSMGARIEIENAPGYTPLVNHRPFMDLFEECVWKLVGPERVNIDHSNWSTGCTDMGDLCGVMPAIQPYTAGAAGSGHGSDYEIEDADRACLNPARAQLLLLHALLSGGAAKAEEIIRGYKPLFTQAEYVEYLESWFASVSPISYGEDGSVEINFRKQMQR